MKPLALALWLVLVPIVADAHVAPAQSFAELSQQLKVGDEIYVLDSQRHELVGIIRGMSADSLDVRLPDRSFQRLSEDHVERIAKVRRSTKKGAIAGAIVGTAFGLLGGVGCRFFIGVALTTVIGGGLGEMHGHLETVYRRVPPMH
jgi:hypothetical protein